MASFSIAVLTLGFIAYFFITHAQAFGRWFSNRWPAERAAVLQIYAQRLAGVLFFGLLPALLYSFQYADFQKIGFNGANFLSQWHWTLGLVAVAILINFLSARSPANLAMYPQIRVAPPWSSSLLVGSALTWIAYLVSYEFLFRGLVLFSCAGEMEKWTAIAVNVSLYALAHVYKGWKETVGAIPLGVVLCLLTLHTGTIWNAVLVHVALGLSNEWWSLFFAARES